MKALIVEDEPLAQDILSMSLKTLFNDIEINGITDSVSSTVEWLQDPANNQDIIFMDVELLDGNCFEIFQAVEIKANVVMTTAYDKYAIRAFEAGSIDYILKPYSDEALSRAVTRCRKHSGQLDQERILSALKQLSEGKFNGKSEYRRRFIIKYGQNIVPVSTSDIAYIYFEGKSKYLVCKSGTKYLFDRSTEELTDNLDPKMFFRVSRRYIVASSVIKGFESIHGGRLKLRVEPAPNPEIIVSRSRVNDFITWME